MRTLQPTTSPSPASAIELVWPSELHLASYVSALNRGWFPDNLRGPRSGQQELERISADPSKFLSLMNDREAKGPPVALPDGSTAPRIPGFNKWIWDGEFCGRIGFRWQPGTPELPPHVLGHIGYSVVPWKQRNGYATKALSLMLVDARAEGLPYVEITTDLSNLPSQKVITANGGTLVGPFQEPQMYGGGTGLRFRITL